MNNNSIQVFKGGWDQLEHGVEINSSIPPSPLIFLVSIVWKPDGTTYFALDATATDRIIQYTVPTPHVTTGSVRVGEFIINALESNPRGMDMSKDGKLLWFIGTVNKKIHQLDMSTGWDILTMSNPDIASNTISLSNPQGLTITNRGKGVYIVDATNDVMQYVLSIANDITTISTEIAAFDITANSQNPRDIRWNPNGMEYFIGSSTFNNISRYTVTEKFDINTSTFADKLNMSGIVGGVQGFFIREDNGKNLYVIDNDDNGIHTFEMSLNVNNTIITNLGEELATNEGDVLVYA